MILLWGIEDDSPLAAVRDAVCRLGVTMALLDQHLVLETAVDLCVGTAVAGIVRTGSRTIDLGAVTAAYLRPSDLPRLRPLARAGSGSRSWRHAVAVTDALWSWAELTPALVVNRPTAMAGNHSKPYQAHQIRSCGFETPETLVTTDAREVLAFRQRHQTVIYKSISGVRSIVARLTPQHLERLDDLAWCPTQFQRYVPGTDYRVHVVGEDVFACEVISQADDYRYAGRQGATVQFRPCDLSGELSSRCRSLVARLGLTVAGVDLRRSTDGTWYCFEVNPSPGFTYYEAATGQPIADAIARLLAAGSSAERAGAVDAAA